MNRVWRTRIVGLALLAGVCSTAFGAMVPENLALKAEVSANNEYSDLHLARWAVDGKIPIALGREDEGEAWCVRGADTGQAGEFTLTWKKPVEVAEIVYFGRTGMIMEECFKDYQVFLDDGAAPVVSGTFEMRHGGQRIKLPQTTAVRKVRIAFLSAYTNKDNPGASEIAVFASSPTDECLQEMTHPVEELTPQARALREDLLSGRLGFGGILLVKRHALNISHVYVYHVEGFQKGGGLYVYTPNKDGGEFRCLVDSSEGMISTADLSYDGKRVVFAWKRGGLEMCQPIEHIEDIDRSISDNNYQVYSVDIDGSNLKQLTAGPHNNLDPSWLPDGGVAFISDRKPAYAYCYVVTSPVLYRMDGDGSNQKRLSANYLMDFTPSVLNDGQIVYTRWEYVDRPACPIQSLWTIKPNGTGLMGFYGNRVISPGTFMDAQPIPGKPQIIATATNHNGPCRGAIVAIDTGKGANSREALTNLTPEIELFHSSGVFGNGLHGPYEKPFALGDEKLLVSKNGALQLRDFAANAVTLLWPEAGLGYYSAQPLRPTPLPPVPVGPTMDEAIVLPEDGSVSGAWATVFMNDVYNGLEPDVKRGEIKRIAVVQEVEKSTHTPQNNEAPDGTGMRNIAVFGYQFPLVSCGATYAPKKLWGFADVNEDGSAIFNVPSEVPIYFLALDGEGRALQRMRSFTHLMPGELQGCVGCHADRNAAAPPSMPMAARQAARSKPQDLIEPEWGVVGFSYASVVQPVFDKYCIGCHNEREQPGNVDLTGDKTDFFNVSYDILARTGTQGERNFMEHNSPLGPDGDAVRGMSPYASWIWTINGAGHNVLEIAPRRWGSPASKLAEIIRSGHPGPDGVKRVDVADADRRRVYLWLDLNVPYYGTSSSNHKNRLGSRRMLPDDLDATLEEVASRRCASCHDAGVPRKFYTRMLEPENNSFMLAPLAKEAGGTERCGQPIFKSKDDPDYRRILETFNPVQELLKRRPRADMKDFALLVD